MRHLAAHRKAAGFTSQDALARRMRISKGTVARWEQGVVMPRAPYLRKLAKTLGISVEELFQPPQEKAAV
jgi:transcriptional regulator with XRE-family HTH domain